jgi:hypothetical protein
MAAAIVIVMVAILPARAIPGIDASHATQHRLGADSCILDAVIIYTDPYVGSRLSHREIVANIAHMCARPFALYSEDLALDGDAAEALLRRTIEAGLRGQFHAPSDLWPERPADR